MSMYLMPISTFFIMLSALCSQQAVTISAAPLENATDMAVYMVNCLDAIRQVRASLVPV